MKDNVIKAVFDFTHRINDDGTYKVSFEYKAESNDISISIVSKQYRSVIDILIQSYNVSSYLHGQGVVNSQQIADLKGITKIARLNRENKKQTMFDIVKSFYRTAHVYQELTNSDEN